ncbi:hypothetical protein LTR91_005588 [Friedmanniomyces endolithicus]|uniref:Uncharacterized protein n=1 Tax=Friedmanniomyces endolithicus TaxID=329885 RepID=A0AAN6KUL6_9PEZI|nr:hypothetical protein LTR94_010009 [Friedmanniomyces endolithicus]KAK0777230.1 hypothetical protein LTR75_016003 [Friedmanniomyces endolithicus]KAK0794119.1 hypothetical protein LTR38_009315 [Friedmanniomyces endolithicus]KAK0808987.1 hypothetical protein LTR59_002691 [Friedmanniomyces endolithicus]KAK0850233.1 hypothetical protein LTR03_004695 [Friedmanniomyces endolithicus]
MAPIPIALCGKSSGMAGSFAKSMLPEYEVIHHFPSTSAAHAELSPLLRGEIFTPQSSVGTDSHRPHTDKPRIPRAIMVGAGFSESELDEMRQIEGAESVPWLYPDPLKSAASALSGPFLMMVIVRRVKGCLRANGVVEGQEGGAKSGVWKF